MKASSLIILIAYCFVPQWLFSQQTTFQQTTAQHTKSKQTASQPTTFKQTTDDLWNVSFKKDAPYLGASLALAGLGTYLRFSADDLLVADITSLDADDINGFDRNASLNFSPQASDISDYLLYSTAALPLTYLFSREMRSDWGEIAVLFVEANLLTLGLTDIVKTTTKRYRPLTYNLAVPMEDKLAPSSRFSFFSGHTSLVATTAFFSGYMINAYSENKALVAVGWTAAAALPATTAYLRVRAGKHFPTDVIAGYALGAASGILIPHFHRNKQQNGTSSVLTMVPIGFEGGAGFHLSLLF